MGSLCTVFFFDKNGLKPFRLHNIWILEAYQEVAAPITVGFQRDYLPRKHYPECVSADREYLHSYGNDTGPVTSSHPQ